MYGNCQKLVGILRDILGMPADYSINVACGEIGGEQGKRHLLHCPNLINLHFSDSAPQAGHRQRIRGQARWLDAR